MNANPFLDYLKYQKEHGKGFVNSTGVAKEFEKRNEDMRNTYTTTDNFRPWKIDIDNIILSNKKGRFPDNNGRIINLLIKNNISDGELT
jgi:hypothetical protein